MINSIGRGDWMQTFTGKQFWSLDPRVEDIDIYDIAHALSMQCRYGGHTLGFYSVAEHCCHVCDYSPPNDKLWGLLHDASEAYLTDVIRPIKPYLGNYAEIENQLMLVIATRFNLPSMPRSVKEVDGRILVNEREQIMSRAPHDWNDTGDPLIGLQLQLWSPAQARAQFMERFSRLSKA
jgi:hypothetical protein